MEQDIRQQPEAQSPETENPTAETPAQPPLEPRPMGQRIAALFGVAGVLLLLLITILAMVGGGR